MVLPCTFAGGMAAVEVRPAPVKRAERIREKLGEYAPPHPRGRWPLAANILDPVRCSGSNPYYRAPRVRGLER